MGEVIGVEAYQRGGQGGDTCLACQGEGPSHSGRFGRIPRILRRPPRILHLLPRIQRRILRIQRRIPRILRRIPRILRRIPSIQRRIPRIQHRIPRIQRRIPRILGHSLLCLRRHLRGAGTGGGANSKEGAAVRSLRWARGMRVRGLLLVRQSLSRCVCVCMCVCVCARARARVYSQVCVLCVCCM